MKRIKMIIASTVAGVAALLMVAGSQPAMAVTCPAGTPGEGKDDVSSLAECSISENKDTFMSTLLNIIKVVLGVLGFVAVVFIIMGGFTYVMSNGDSAKLTKAKNTILYAVIGLVVALLAFAIVNFILDNVFNGEGTESSSVGTSVAVK